MADTITRTLFIPKPARAVGNDSFGISHLLSISLFLRVAVGRPAMFRVALFLFHPTLFFVCRIARMTEAMPVPGHTHPDTVAQPKNHEQ